MRLWHYKLLPYLPKAQLVSQWRECLCIAKNIHDNGTPNHLLVNRIMGYNICDFRVYCERVADAMRKRNINIRTDSLSKLNTYVGNLANSLHSVNSLDIFIGWHDKMYLDVCYYNLLEKHFYGIGNSRITDEEWEIIERGYNESKDDL